MARRQGEEIERCKSVSMLQRMIGGKWKIEILFYIALKDVRHFGQLRRCHRQHIRIHALKAAQGTRG